MPKDKKDGGGWEIEVEADIPIKTTKHDIEGDAVMDELRKICEIESAKKVVDPKAWIKKLPYSFGERIFGAVGATATTGAWCERRARNQPFV